MSERLRTVSRKALKKYQTDAARIAEIITKKAEQYEAAKNQTTAEPGE
jgi:hypothetical protein